MTSELRFDTAAVAAVTHAASDALSVCARTELAARGAALLVARRDPGLGAELGDVAHLAHRCGVALTRWCSATDGAVLAFTAVEATLAAAPALPRPATRDVRVLERTITRLAPYLDDAGHTLRAAAVLAGRAHGLTPGEAFALTTVPGQLGRLVARALPEGDGRALPAGHATVAAGTASSVAGWLQTVAALPDATIGIADVGGGWVVSLPGIHDFGDGPDPMDLYGAARGLLAGTSAYAHAVAKALDLACVPIGAPVMLVGHSQGGIAAMDLAADPHVNGRRVRVTHVVTAGAPVSGLHPAPGSDTRVLELDNDADLVPQLDLRDSRRGSGDGRIALVFRHDDGSIGGDHGLLTAYVPFAASARFATAPGVADWVSSAATYLRGAAVGQQRFALRDR